MRITILKDYPATGKMTEQAIIATDKTDLVTGDRAELSPRALPPDQNPAAVYLLSLSEGSRRTMRRALDTIADLVSGGRATALTLPWARLRFQHTAAIRAQLAERYAPATANKMLSALRGVLKAAHRLGQMDAEDYQNAVDVESVRGDTLLAGRHISAGEIAALVDACQGDQTAAGVRDAAIIGVLTLGLRRGEVVALDVADYDAGAGTLKVRGKRRKERLVPVAGGVADAVDDWLALRGEKSGALFLPVRKGGHVQSGRLNNQAVYDVLARRAEQAGVGDLSPHDFRRTFVGDLLDAGADLSVVQKLVGHANVTTTARYDRRDEKAKRKAVNLLHFPYRRRVLGDG
jgi:integrase